MYLICNAIQHENIGTDNNGADNNGPDNNGADNNGPDNNGADNIGTDNNGPDNNGAGNITSKWIRHTNSKIPKQILFDMVTNFIYNEYILNVPLFVSHQHASGIMPFVALQTAKLTQHVITLLLYIAYL